MRYLSILDPPSTGHVKKKLCAGAMDREGRGAPVRAPARPAQVSTEKHMFRTALLPEAAMGKQKLCAGAMVGEGRGAPVRAPAPRAQLSPEKLICFGPSFFAFLANSSPKHVS